MEGNIQFGSDIERAAFIAVSRWYSVEYRGYADRDCLDLLAPFPTHLVQHLIDNWDNPDTFGSWAIFLSHRTMWKLCVGRIPADREVRTVVPRRTIPYLKSSMKMFLRHVGKLPKEDPAREVMIYIIASCIEQFGSSDAERLLSKMKLPSLTMENDHRAIYAILGILQDPDIGEEEPDNHYVQYRRRDLWLPGRQLSGAEMAFVLRHFELDRVGTIADVLDEDLPSNTLFELVGLKWSDVRKKLHIVRYVTRCDELGIACNERLATEVAKAAKSNKDLGSQYEDPNVYVELQQLWQQADVRYETIPRIAVSEGDYTIRVLDRDDPAGAMLGVYTGCCQHLMDAGYSCMLHGRLSPYGSFVVLEHKGTIRMQSWVWRIGDSLVFDNVEGFKSPDTESLYRDLYIRLAREFVGKLGIETVYCGHGNSDLGFPDCKSLYSDSVSGFALPSVEVGEPEFKFTQHSYGNIHCYSDARSHVWVLAGAEKRSVIAKLRDLEEKLYPPQFRSFTDMTCWEDLCEYADSPDTQVHFLSSGYLITTPKEVVDVATSNPSDMADVLRILKDTYRDGWFHADLRESTSLPLVRTLVSRNRMDIQVLNVWNWEGTEEMTSCNLRFVSAEERKTRRLAALPDTDRIFVYDRFKYSDLVQEDLLYRASIQQILLNRSSGTCLITEHELHDTYDDDDCRSMVLQSKTFSDPIGEVFNALLNMADGNRYLVLVNPNPEDCDSEGYPMEHVFRGMIRDYWTCSEYPNVTDCESDIECEHCVNCLPCWEIGMVSIPDTGDDWEDGD